MRYEIKYKTKYSAGWDEFPIIKIRYRCCGAALWRIIKQDLDKFAQLRGLGNYSSGADRHWYSTEERAEMFKASLDGSYCRGSLDTYVRYIVLNKVETEMNNKKRSTEAEALISGWVTTGWKSIELDTNDRDELKQHSNE